jgi:hypothetical protein
MFLLDSFEYYFYVNKYSFLRIVSLLQIIICNFDMNNCLVYMHGNDEI